MARQWEKMEGRPTKPVARSKVVRSSGLRPIKVIISIRPGLIKDWHVKRKYDDPATLGQIRYITMLAVKKGIREPIEERKMILGGAGMQIRGLQSLPVPPMVILAIILLFYIPLGMFLDTASMLFMTMPLIYPAVITLGFDGIWFGVLYVVMVEIAQITPPVGMNVFVIKAIAPDVPLYDIFRGAGYFVGLHLIALTVIIAFPQISLFLPSLMD